VPDPIGYTPGAPSTLMRSMQIRSNLISGAGPRGLVVRPNPGSKFSDFDTL